MCVFPNTTAGELKCPRFSYISFRFSDVGDAVLVSAGLRDTSLAHTALLAGRTLVVLEPDVVNIDKTAAALDDMTASASKSGIWARMLSKPLVTVGPGRRPILVPASNIPTSTAEKVEQARQGGDEHPERTVAKGHAANHGLEIKVRLYGILLDLDFVS